MRLIRLARPGDSPEASADLAEDRSGLPNETSQREADGEGAAPPHDGPIAEVAETEGSSEIGDLPALPHPDSTLPRKEQGPGTSPGWRDGRCGRRVCGRAVWRPVCGCDGQVSSATRQEAAS